MWKSATKSSKVGITLILFGLSVISLTIGGNNRDPRTFGHFEFFLSRLRASDRRFCSLPHLARLIAAENGIENQENQGHHFDRESWILNVTVESLVEALLFLFGVGCIAVGWWLLAYAHKITVGMILIFSSAPVFPLFCLRIGVAVPALVSFIPIGRKCDALITNPKAVVRNLEALSRSCWSSRCFTSGPHSASTMNFAPLNSERSRSASRSSPRSSLS